MMGWGWIHVSKRSPGRIYAIAKDYTVYDLLVNSQTKNVNVNSTLFEFCMECDIQQPRNYSLSHMIFIHERQVVLFVVNVLIIHFRLNHGCLNSLCLLSTINRLVEAIIFLTQTKLVTSSSPFSSQMVQKNADTISPKMVAWFALN